MEQSYDDDDDDDDGRSSKANIWRRGKAQITVMMMIEDARI